MGALPGRCGAPLLSRVTRRRIRDRQELTQGHSGTLPWTSQFDYLSTNSIACSRAAGETRIRPV